MQVPVELLLTPDLIIRCLLGFAVGALIGLERQSRAREGGGLGVRSFGLHSLLGMIASYSYTVTSVAATGTTPAIPGNPIILIYATAVSLILVAGNVGFKMVRTHRGGVTTSVVFAMSFVLGALVGLDSIPADGQLLGPLSTLSMTVAFLVFLVLGFKEELAAAVSNISKEEMISAAELGVLILFLWPLIPPTIQLGAIEVPIFQIYFLVVILLLISFANYLLVKRFKGRGSYFLGFFGGFANSEATVTSLTEYYVKSGRRNVDRISIGGILANIAMVLRNGFLILLLDPSGTVFRYYLIPLAILTMMGLIRMSLERRKRVHREDEEIEDKIVSPFSFGAALRFAVVFGGVSILGLILQTYFSDWGMIAAAIFGGFVSAGAVVAVAVPLFATGAISLATAVYAVILATVTSVLNKTMYVYLADREMTLFKRVIKDTLIMAVGVFLYLILLGLGAIPMI